VSVSVPPGITGLLGPNGAGKSTFMKLITGQLRPSKGSVRVLGEPMWHNPAIYFRVGFCPEQDSFYDRMTGHEWIAALVRLNGLSEREATEAAQRALAAVDLTDAANKRIGAYSKGMRQRVKLAQALVHDPELLFLDEPTAGLDPRGRDEMLELIAELPARRNCTIVLSTHLLPDVERVCDRAVIMHRGRVRFVGTIDELRGARGRETGLAIVVKADAQRFADALVAAGARCKVTSPTELAIDLPESASNRLVFATARTAGVQVRSLAVRRESVETAFLRVIGEGCLDERSEEHS